MILCDFQIRQLCEAGMVSPFDPALLNPASLDVRLGEQIMIEALNQSGWAPFSLAGYSEANPWLLGAGQFILGETVELFNIPETISAQFLLKSSRAREGLNHLLAGWIDPGWHGSRLTLELHNVRQLHPVALWPGMKIGQIVFHDLSAQPERSYATTGRYNMDANVTASKG
jgi:dCTP deaminase